MVNKDQIKMFHGVSCSHVLMCFLQILVHFNKKGLLMCKSHWPLYLWFCCKLAHKLNIINLHDNAAIKEPVFPMLSVKADWQLSNKWFAPLCFGDAVRHTGYLVCYTHLTLPLVLRHFLQWRLHTLQMVNGWTCLTAQQVTKAMAYPAMVVVGNHPFWH